MQQFTFAARGRHYRVKTEELGTAFSMTGFWMYQPSVILPSPLTGNKYVLLLNRNKNSGQGQTHGEVITARTSSDPTGFGSETTILDNSDVDNICDMAVARPIWDGSHWHIYVQARAGVISQEGPCNADTNPANIYEAIGSSLNPPGSFQWVKVPATNHAQAVISGTAGTIGIAEDMQWYNPSAYGLPGFPFMVTYQNWGDPNFPTDVFSYISQDDSTYNFWYGPETTPSFHPPNGGFALLFPDAILLGSLDAARKGNPGVGLASTCASPNTGFEYALGIGLFNNPSNVPPNSPRTGTAFPGLLDGVAQDSNGPRMFRPKVARNEYGYIPPQSRRGYPRTWVTYLYYTYTQIRDASDTSCAGFSHFTSTNSIGVSRLTVTETR